MLKQEANLENLSKFITYYKKTFSSLGVDNDTLGQVELALEEVIVNIINYAYQDNSGQIQIECKIENENMVIEISDWGLPFDLMSKEDPDISLSLEEREVGGLGIFLAKQIMDKIYYERIDNMNLVTLVKKV